MNTAPPISMIDAALAYSARGWPVFPLHSIRNGRCSCGGRAGCKPGKHPRCKGGFKAATTDICQIRNLWRKWPDANIGIPTGAVTRTVLLDIDPCHGGDVSLELIESEHGPVPHTVEAISGGGGRHVFFAHPGFHVGCRTGVRHGIDIRGDGGYFVADPSSHISGKRYSWELSHLPDETPFAAAPKWFLELACERRLTERTETTEKTETTEITEPNGSVVSVVSVLSVASLPANVAESVANAIESTLPRAAGQRNDAVFEFARALRAVSSLKSADMKTLRPLVVLWHRRAYPVIGTKPFEDTWADFLRGYPRVQFPKGEEPMSLIFARAEQSQPPIGAADYQSEAMVRLIKLCRELQRHSMDKPFFLACRTAGELLGIDHTTAASYLRVLCADEILRIDKKSTTKDATRYHYVGEN